MRNRKIWASLLLCALLVFSVAGCSDNKETPSSKAAVSSGTATASPKATATVKPTVKPSPKSTAKASATPTATPTQAPTQAPESSAVSSAAQTTSPYEPTGPGEQVVPPIGVGDPAFQQAFTGNAIDVQTENDMAAAGTLSAIARAYDTAISNWKAMVDVAYQSAVEVSSEEQSATLAEEQSAWASQAEATAEELKSNASGDQNATLGAYREITALYRDRAATLCAIRYAADGTLPDFPTGGGPVG